MNAIQTTTCQGCDDCAATGRYILTLDDGSTLAALFCADCADLTQDQILDGDNGITAIVADGGAQ
jgi:coenzyme F420-reducing hydrogenase beta subunit